LIKKLFAAAIATGLLFSLAGSTPANEEKYDGDQPGQKVERALPVAPQAVITLCVAAGTLTVRGSDKQEVRVRSADAVEIGFRRIDKPKDLSVPASRVDVMVLDKASRANPKMDCQAIADVQMEVPANATVQVQTRDGDISIAGVAAVYAGSQNGDITIERATRLVEAGSVGGSILLKDSSGRVNLTSAGGGVEAVGVRGADAEDTFEVGTVSGDIQLDRISNPKVMAKTVNGTVTMSGALVKSGYYAFTNMTGDLLLVLPHDASFRLNAKVSEKHDIVSDFVLKYLAETPTPLPPQTMPPAPPADKAPRVAPPDVKKGPAVKDSKTSLPKEKEKPMAKGGVAPTAPLVTIEKPTVIVAPYVRRVEAICGTGDATISVASFGGTVRLKKL
jgi:putative adhesin